MFNRKIHFIQFLYYCLIFSNFKIEIKNVDLMYRRPEDGPGLLHLNLAFTFLYKKN